MASANIIARFESKLESQAARMESKLEAKFDALTAELAALKDQMRRERAMLWALIGLISAAALRYLLGA